MFKKLLACLLNRWVIALLGLLALSLLIWFVGPLIAIADYRPLEPGAIRAALIALAILFYIGKQLWKLLKARRANARLMDGLLKQPASQASAVDPVAAEELATLGKRFADAIVVLKKARLSERGRNSVLDLLANLRQQWVYELPWYIMIGSPGSGKTTALANSGLQFPLSERFGQAAIRGVGGTRNCDWWFTDRAVLLDTAGRYTTQDSNQQADSAAWTGFMQLLKKYRVRRPINGVLLTLSVPELLEQSPAKRASHIEALRMRLQELHDELDIRFPLYVLVTKIDLLPGCMEFFSDMGKEERAQVWGTTFPYREAGTEAATAPAFSADFAALEERINARLIDRMQQERDPQRRALLYAFPQQLAAVKTTLCEFVDHLTSTSRFTDQPLLRGVYFTSGTQEGSPIDRLMGSLGRALQLERKVLPPNTPSGKSYFITRLLDRVVFQEAGLAGINQRWERRRARLQLAALLLAGLLCIGAIAAWTVSFARNRAYITDVQARTAAVSRQLEQLGAISTTNVVELLPAMQAVRDLARVANVPEGSPPASMGFGLYQGDKLAAASRSSHRRLLHDVFLPRLELRVQQQLQSDGQSNPELLYEALKAYLMLHDGRYMNPAALKAFITADWENSLPREVTLGQRQDLERHLDMLLASGDVLAPNPADPRLIAAARQALAQTPLAERIYNRIKRQGAGSNLPDFTIANAGGPSAMLVFTRRSEAAPGKGVPGIYSVNAYRQVFMQEAARVTGQLADEEGWVLGLTERERGLAAPDKNSALVDEVQRLYLQDYARTWAGFIDDIALVRASSLKQSIEQARILSAPDSPLPLLLRAIVKEVTLVQLDEADKTVADKAGDKIRSTREELRKLFGQGASQESAASGLALPENIVDRQFDALRRQVRSPAPGQPAPIDASIALINELYLLLTATDAALKGASTPPPSDVPNKVKAEGSRMPEPLRGVMLTLSAGGASQALGLTRSNLSQAMQGALGDFCSKAISGRYPFSKASARDVTPDDFSRLFAPGGLMDDFFQKNLAQYVNTATRPWSFRPVGDASQGPSSAALLQFQRAQVIRDVFFRNSPAISMRLDLKPTMMDASINQFILDVDGQLVKYSHGPQVPAPVLWPGPRGSTQVRLQLSPVSTSGASGRTFEGAWALFRLFDQVQLDGTGQPEKFLATFNVDGRKAQFEVLTNSVRNPFRLPELEQFQCPGTL
ncbi:type VI secretion system protein ImpL [Duganella sp. CF458]|uniref:type VI secretion system membrane subunit TssM n=1 Tax=Duganella sp. CF458 TaxID=1884368 RepID=UPI0008EA19AC|nr:type VI secretion system membrane subunit TssM [Duganella sp. CF458]SFG09877.1 type VI secretion system protein ImpL [Duganella sp. CF458]